MVLGYVGEEDYALLNSQKRRSFKLTHKIGIGSVAAVGILGLTGILYMNNLTDKGKIPSPQTDISTSYKQPNSRGEFKMYGIQTEHELTQLLVNKENNTIFAVSDSEDLNKYCANLPSNVPQAEKSKWYMKEDVKKFEQICKDQPENVRNKITALYKEGMN